MSGRISSISIRPKLITAFTLLLAGTIGLGLFAVERLDGVNVIAADLQDNWLPATRHPRRYGPRRRTVSPEPGHVGR